MGGREGGGERKSDRELGRARGVRERERERERERQDLMLVVGNSVVAEAVR